MSTAIEILSASQGTFVVNNTTEKTITHDGILVLEDTVFSSIKVGGADIKSNLIADVVGTVKAGAFIRPLSADKFSGVQLVSGSVILVLWFTAWGFL